MQFKILFTMGMIGRNCDFYSIIGRRISISIILGLSALSASVDEITACFGSGGTIGMVGKLESENTTWTNSLDLGSISFLDSIFSLTPSTVPSHPRITSCIAGNGCCIVGIVINLA